MIDRLISTIQTNLMPSKKIDIFGKNSLMFSTIPYYSLSLVIFTTLYGNVNVFLIIFIIYGIVPLLDEYFSHDEKNPTKQERIQLEKNDIYFKMSLYSSIILDWIAFFRIMNYFANFDWEITRILELVGTLFILSNLNAIQFAVAHQIFHKNGIFYKVLGTLHMSKLLYMHFTYQHIWGHHRKVATPQDPASAEQGITLYKFFPRSFFGSYKSVYQMEKDAKKPIYLNCSVLSVVAAITFIIGIGCYYNFQAMILFIILEFGAIFYLEAINYIEHYGLRRNKLQDGTYEKVTIRHSWNAPHRFSNYLLYKLQRHSDHHENSLKPFQILLSLEQSPHLPHSYIVTIFLSFFPSLWFKIMDPIVEQYKIHKKGKVDSQLMRRSMHQTRKFIIQLFLGTGLIWLVSQMIN